MFVLFMDMFNYVIFSIFELIVKDRDSYISCNKFIVLEQKFKLIDNIDEFCQFFKDSQYMVDEILGCYKILRFNKIIGFYEVLRFGFK